MQEYAKFIRPAHPLPHTLAQLVHHRCPVHTPRWAPATATLRSRDRPISTERPQLEGSLLSERYVAYHYCLRRASGYRSICAVPDAVKRRIQVCSFLTSKGTRRHYDLRSPARPSPRQSHPRALCAPARPPRHWDPSKGQLTPSFSPSRQAFDIGRFSAPGGPNPAYGVNSPRARAQDMTRTSNIEYTAAARPKGYRGLRGRPLVPYALRACSPAAGGTRPARVRVPSR